MLETSADPPPAAADVRLTLLGAFRLEAAGRVVPLTTRKAEGLLAYLALHVTPAGHSREKLAALFWGDSPDADARRSLRVALAALRRALPGEPFVADRESLGLDPAYPLWVDATRCAAAAGRILAGRADAMDAADLDLYRADLLPDCYDDWLNPLRQQLRDRYLAARHAQVERLRTAGEYRAVVQTAQRILAVEPVDEAAHQHLMFCHVTLGDRSAALAQYQACVRALREELAVEPSPQTEALHRWIRQSAPGGRAPAARRGNVPLALASLIGRQHETAALTHMLLPAPLSFAGRGAGGEGQSLAGAGDDGPSQRLVTLTGPGGTGKTRLAQEVALALTERMRDGAWWVDLVPLAEAALVPQAVAKALGIPEAPGQPPVATLVQHLQEQQALLVLDNCEHLIGGCAHLVADLLTRCPELRVLTTSREALGVPGERVWPLAPLTVPERKLPVELGSLLRYGAVALFIERAAAHRPGFSLTPENAAAVAEICCRLDGIPLALELAAARVRILSIQQIAERLDDRLRLLQGGARTALPRQQTLQALMDWSYDLLTPAEQALFRRLAIFAGGWTLAAAEAVCAVASGGEMAFAAADVPDLLGRLADKSLILVEDAPDGRRCGFLETILAYARGRLADPAEADAVVERHLDYYLRLAEDAGPHLRGPQMFAWLARLDREHDNLSAALARALVPAAAAPRRLAGMRLAAALEIPWYMRGYAGEGRCWLEDALALAPADAPQALIAKTHAAAGTMAWLAGDYVQAQAHHMAALAGQRAVGDLCGAAWALGNLGVCANELGDHAGALALYAEASGLAQATDATWEQALILNNWSAALMDLGRAAEAIPLLETSTALLRKTGDAWAASHPTLNLAEIATERGDTDRAAHLLAEMVALAAHLHVESLDAAVRLRQGALHLRLGQPDRAVECYRASLGSYATLADRVGTLRALDGLAVALAEAGAYPLAARLLAAADAQRAAGGSARQPVELALVERCLARLRAQMASDALAAAQAAGRDLRLDEAIALAMGPQ